MDRVMKKTFSSLPALIGLIVIVGSAFPQAPARQGSTPTYGFRVVNTYPHDPQAYTQGLLYRDGFLFESTGRRGRSFLRKVRIETGEVVQETVVSSEFFAEGLALWNDRLIQLTWEAHIGFVYDLSSLRLESTFRYPGEGWGLTADRSSLIMSDGTDTLRFLEPSDFGEQRRLRVTEGTSGVGNLNELEYVNGQIYANVWHTDRIARISPESGEVVGWIDLTGLLPPTFRLTDREAVLNGIAYDAGSDRLFVTGKLWPRLFEIELVERR
jgi:glutaminyl-peptide cyclotransferase